MFTGLVTGIILSPQTGLIARETAEVTGSWLAIPGNIFLGLIQMIVVPLIFVSVIRGLASSDDDSCLPADCQPLCPLQPVEFPLSSA